jgi:hypothetical protein
VIYLSLRWTRSYQNYQNYFFFKRLQRKKNQLNKKKDLDFKKEIYLITSATSSPSTLSLDDKMISLI